MAHYFNRNLTQERTITILKSAENTSLLLGRRNYFKSLEEKFAKKILNKYQILCVNNQ